LAYVARVVDVDALVAALHYAHFDDPVTHILRRDERAGDDVAALLVPLGDLIGERLHLGQRQSAAGLAEQRLELARWKYRGPGDAKAQDEERWRIRLLVAGRRLDPDLRRRRLARRLRCAQLLLD